MKIHLQCIAKYKQKRRDCKKTVTVGADILTSLNINCTETLATGRRWLENGSKRQGKRRKDIKKNKNKMEYKKPTLYLPLILFV
jgi:hypothetical protein